MFKRWACCSVFLLAYAVSPVIAEGEINDPLEGFNRGVFAVNDRLDRYVLEPAAIGYDAVVPDFVQDGVGNFFETLRYPKYLVNDLLQAKFTQAAEHTGRFAINVLLGVGGLIDVADSFGLKAHHEDFGITMATWGVGHGAYLVLPIFGPSSIRDGIGRLVDTAFDPLWWVSYNGTMLKNNEELYVTAGGRALEGVHDRAQLREGMDTLRESSLDLYLSMQSSYYQYREGVVYDGEPPLDDDEDWMNDEEEE
ncbi:MAG: VacJ family lipoprotein [Bdellovibrionales bacterium]|nr:VacJ family lipoprotein [Bdellovibrionales bacterium]